jgi:hypothetical protein
MLLALFVIGGIELLALLLIASLICGFWVLLRTSRSKLTAKHAAEGSEVARSIKGLTGTISTLVVLGGVVAFVGWVPLRDCPNCKGLGGLLGVKCPTCGGAGKQTAWQLLTDTLNHGH